MWGRKAEKLVQFGQVGALMGALAVFAMALLTNVGDDVGGRAVLPAEAATVIGAQACAASGTNRYVCYGGGSEQCGGCGCVWESPPIGAGMRKYDTLKCKDDPFCTEQRFNGFLCSGR